MQCSSRHVLAGSSGPSSPCLAAGSWTPRAPWGGHPSEMGYRETQGTGTWQEEQTSLWPDQWMRAWRAEGQDPSCQGQARHGSSMGLPSALPPGSLTHSSGTSQHHPAGKSLGQAPAGSHLGCGLTAVPCGPQTTIPPQPCSA